MPYLMADGRDVLEDDRLEGGLEGFSLKRVGRKVKKVVKRYKRPIAYVLAPTTFGASLLITKKGKKVFMRHGKYAILGAGIVGATVTGGATIALASGAVAMLEKKKAEEKAKAMAEKEARLLSESAIDPELETVECPEGYVPELVPAGVAGVRARWRVAV